MTISRVAITGGGLMGSGIAEATAAAGKNVIVYELESAPLDRSRERLAHSLDRAVSRNKRTPEDAQALASRVTFTTSLQDLEGVDAVLEAVVEDPHVKGKLFQQLDAQLPDAQFLASNTSSIPIAEIASWTQRPGRVIGLHFFSPVPVMKLVEVVVALDTDPETVRIAESFAAAIGKKTIRTKDRSGFIVNMLLVPYLMAAVLV